MIDKLPEGIKRVERYVEQMLGDMLEVETNDEITIRIDCLRLGAHEGAVVVYRNGDEINDGGAYINFDKQLPFTSGCF